MEWGKAVQDHDLLLSCLILFKADPVLSPPVLILILALILILILIANDTMCYSPTTLVLVTDGTLGC